MKCNRVKAEIGFNLAMRPSPILRHCIRIQTSNESEANIGLHACRSRKVINKCNSFVYIDIPTNRTKLDIGLCKTKRQERMKNRLIYAYVKTVYSLWGVGKGF